MAVPTNRLDYAPPDPSKTTWPWPTVVMLGLCAAFILYVLMRLIRMVIDGIDC